MDGRALLDDRYRLGERLGRGGACEVFRGRDERLQRDVAIKVLHGEGVGDAARLATEVELLASFNHPGLVQVFDAGQVDGDPYVVLELVEGSTLADRLRDGPLDAATVSTLGVSLADALVSVHERGVVHRDISPGNVLCGADGRVRLADFGIARLVDEAGRTSTSVALGTPAYMAPEQVRGVAATPAADVYALGLVLLEALTGARAFPGPSTEAALARLTRSPDLSAVPGEWRSVLESMTATAPEERPSTVEVRSQLEALAAAPAEVTAPVWAGPADGTVDPHAPTVATPLPLDEPSGDTAVLPLTALPVDPPPSDRTRNRRILAGVLVAFLLVLAAGVAQATDGGPPSLTPSTTSSTAPPTTEPAVEVTAPAPSTTEPPPAPEPKEKGKGKGKEKRGG